MSRFNLCFVMFFFHLLLTLFSLCVRKVNDGFKRFPSDQNLQAHSKVSGPKLALVPKTNTQCLPYLCSFSFCTVWTTSRTVSHGHITYLNLSAKYFFWHCHMHTQIMLGGFPNMIMYFLELEEGHSYLVALVLLDMLEIRAIFSLASSVPNFSPSL